MDRKSSQGVKALQDSGLGSFGSESDTSPVLPNSLVFVKVDRHPLSTDTAPGEACHMSDEAGDVRSVDVASGVVGDVGGGDMAPNASTFTVFYLGESVLDRIYHPSMLPWVVSELRRHKSKHEIILRVKSDVLQASIDGSPPVVLFEHQLQTISRFGKMHQDPKSFVYLTRTESDLPFSCHGFQAQQENDVQQIFRAIKQASISAMKAYEAQATSPATSSLCDPKHHHLFEVLYVGKVLVSSKKAPPTFIDEAVKKFHEYEDKKEADRQRRASGGSVRSLPLNLEAAVTVNEDELSHQSSALTSSSSSESNGRSSPRPGDSSENLAVSESHSNEAIHALLHDPPTTEATDGGIRPVMRKDTESLQRQAVTTGTAQRNRTMLLQVGQSHVCLVSPNRKSVIFERKFKDISFCSQGIQHPQHFGFISRDPASGNFVCYVFKCASESVVEEVMQDLKTAFQAAFQTITAKNHVVCELCPMHQLHKLCQEIDKLSADKVHEILQNRVDQLNDGDHREVLSKLKMENPQNIGEVNECIMIILRHMCEARQKDHVHLSDSNKSNAKNEIILCETSRQKLAPPSKLDNLKNRAKKSLTNSFENLVREKLNWAIAQQDSLYCSTPPMSPSSTSSSSNSSFQFSDSPLSPRAPVMRGRPRSSTVPDISLHKTHQLRERIAEQAEVHGQKAPPPPARDNNETPLRSMFVRVGRGDTSAVKELISPSASPALTPQPQVTSPLTSTPSSDPRRRPGSWRLDILNRVVTPARRRRISTDDTKEGCSFQARALWRKAILETLLLIRMEKENKTLQGYFVLYGSSSVVLFQARQDEVEMKRQKLDYEEITPCLKKVTQVWDSLLLDPQRPNVKVNWNMLTHTVKDGVPRSKRGEIWLYCMEQHALQDDQLICSWPPEGADANVSYNDLLKQLTMHQHAILIDLGRTFPMHPYFSTQLGPGQLALFNLLKAYSLLDREVGYCQGLSFVAGILLMHMAEDRAFILMKYMMFNLGLRRQYRPDMTALQIQMYQLSRLLHDHYRDLYDHLEEHEVAPTLYAAPWFLTLFASQFPLGFVARVFDLIFLQGLEVIFKVALVLLGNHRELIKQCDGFETVVEFLKTTLPGMGIIQMERVINQVLQLDITRQLQAYEVEYHVLQEEMISSPPDPPNSSTEAHIHALEVTNHSLLQHKVELLEQLQTTRSHARGLEGQVDELHTEQIKLKSHIRTLELERAAMLNAITRLREKVPRAVLESHDLQIPALDPNRTITNSPIHNPLVNPLVAQFMEEGKIKLANNSLTELDREVALLMASHRQSSTAGKDKLSAVKHSHPDRPASSNI